MSIRNSAIGANVSACEQYDEVLSREEQEDANEENQHENRDEADENEADENEADDHRASKSSRIDGEVYAQNDNVRSGENVTDSGAAHDAAAAEARSVYLPSADTPERMAMAELTKANTRLRLITQITSQVIGTAPLDGQLTGLAGQVRAAFDADACVIRALEAEELRLLASDGIPIAQLHPYIKIGWGISGEIMASSRPLVIGDVRLHPATANVTNTLSDAYTFYAYAGAPLLAEGQVVGILGLYSRQPGTFAVTAGDDLQIVARHIAVAIANDRLYQRMTQQTQELEQQTQKLEQQVMERLNAETALRLSMEHLQRSLDGTVLAMSSVVEMRDPYTAGHQRRVAALACVMAAHLGLPAAEIETLRIAGLLHDIGKIVVPAQILCKPTELIKPERAIIQTHAEVGYAILKDTALPDEVALVALQHHERLDGSGYPAGLREAQIIPAAQLMAVADVVEAMVSDRPYRAGLPIEEAMAEIMQRRGTRYQAKAVDACMAVLEQNEYDLEILLAGEKG